MHSGIQDYSYINIRAAAALTGSYVASTDISALTPNFPTKVELRNQLVLYVDLTLGNLTSAQVKLEFSHDGVTYYQEAFTSISNGTDTVNLGEHSMASSGKYRLAFPIKDVHVKVSAKGTGDATGSSMAIGAIIGVA